MNIRPFQKDDEKAISQCIWETTMNPDQLHPPVKFYPKDLLEVHLQNYTPEKIVEKSQNSKIFVAEVKNKIIGTVFVLPKEKIIRGLFVLPPFQRKKIGHQLMQYAENWCRNHHIWKIIIPASLNAVTFYPPLGYTNPQEKTVLANGKEIREIWMEKNLKNETY